MKAAQAFILTTEQRGSVKPETFLETPTRSSMVCMVMGRAAPDDFEKKATDRAGPIALNVLIGEMPFAFKRRGKTMIPWMRLAPTTQTR
ncbi:MAG: hypothetical protein S4CHLAM81_03030 [Chlamydiales bacterium]|nr:hypothetical protein [Chlamydiales bacterium]MCH9635093.1 hypothetical protein [Chlamydiales bacterium]